MNVINLFSALISVPLFYLIYHRYFLFKPVFLKHLEAFLSGFAYAILLVLLAPFINTFLGEGSPLFTAFVRAALIEKAGAYIILIFIFRYFRSFTLLESILTAMMFALGFAVVENLFYALTFGGNIAIIRLLFSSPLHLTTCAIMGLYLGRSRFLHTPYYKIKNMAAAFIIPILLHGLFDFLLIKGGGVSFLIPLLLLTTIFTLEKMMARSQSVISLDILKAMKLRFEDYELLVKQKKYERWIKHSMGRPDIKEIALFLGKPGTIRVLIFLMLVLLAFIGLAAREEIFAYLDLSLRREEEVILLGIFPFFIGLSVILVGSVDPDFFEMSELKIPVITEVDLLKDDDLEETLVTYDITRVNCFLRTAEDIGVGNHFKVEFAFNNHYSQAVDAEVVWENHRNKREAMGSIISFDCSNRAFVFFLIRYNFFRFLKGITFNLRLPGFELTRKFFMQPISAVEEDEVYEPGTILFREGDKGTRFYLIKKGRVILYKKKSDDEIITVNTIDRGQIIGEMSLAPKSLHTVSAICASECIIASAAKANLNALLLNNVEFSRTFIDTLVERIAMSERTLVQYIKEIEHTKRENERFFHASLMFIFLELGFSPEGNKAEGVDLKKMGDIVKSMNSDEMGDLINLITYKLTRSKEEMDEANILINKKLEAFYSKFEVNL
jgi:CRP-like cAMP-binding protein/RsiW-degrading membrane proteinase PrsW (M82 family)